MKKVKTALILLRYTTPPLIAFILTMKITMVWPIQGYSIFLFAYNALLYSTRNVVYLSRLPFPIRARNFILLLILSILSSMYLGIIGEVMGVGILSLVMVELHESHMLRYSCSQATLLRDAVIFTLTPLVLAWTIFGFSTVLLAGGVSYFVYLFSKVSKKFSHLPKLRSYR